jgi:hypothetical protein
MPILPSNLPDPLSRLALTVPRACPHCASTGTLQLQHILRGNSILLNWSCVRCGEESPIDSIDGDHGERSDSHDVSRSLPRKSY